MTTQPQTKSFPDLREIQFHLAMESLAAEDTTELIPGTRLGRYVILYRIGSGGMGVVYAAYDPELDRKVALKLLTRHLDAKQAEALTRREAQAMARLTHPNVVTVHDVCAYGDQVFIAMEHLEGQTLREWLAEEPRSWREILEVYLQAGRGLAAAHAVDLVHLDFKPGNVMLTKDGQARVLDFGLAQLDLGVDGPQLEASSPSSGETPSIEDETRQWIVTDRDTLHGTPAYLAPERLSGMADARSDQFSFCVALYEALYGERPFAGESMDDYLAEVQRGAIREAAGKRVPGWVRKALLRGLSPQPGERFLDMETLLQALSPEPHRARGQRWLVAAFVGLLLGIVGINYWTTPPAQAQVCSGSAERLVGVWDDDSRAAVRTAFLATGNAFAEQAWGDVSQAIDRYTQDWVQHHNEACEATHVRGEQSERMLDLRMMCLDWRLDQVRALTTVLTEVDSRAMANAVRTARKLEPLDACSDRPGLMSWQLPPAETEVRRAVEELRAEIEVHSTRWKLSRSVEPERLKQSAERAQELDYPPVAASALFLLAEVQLFAVGEAETAEATFKEALLAALAAGDRELQTRIFGALAQTIGYFGGRPEEAQLWARAAQAMLSALGPGYEVAEGAVFETLRMLAQATGDQEEEERLAAQALEIAERVWGPADPQITHQLHNVAEPLGRDRLPEKILLLERALANAENAEEGWNPIYMAPSLMNLSYAYHDVGRYEESLEVASRCLEVLEDFYGEHADLTYPLLRSGFLRTYYLDQPIEAEKDLRRAIPMAEAGFGAQHPMMGYLLNILGDALVRQHRHDEAVSFLRQALVLREEQLPTGHRDRAASYNSLGGWFLARQNPEAALEPLTRALALAGEELQQDPRLALAIRAHLGEAHLGLRQTAEARAYAEQVLAMDGAERFPRETSQARFILARALGADERARAVALTTQALQNLSGTSSFTQEQRQQMENWLRRYS